jgi:hypothetical protein
MTEYVVLAEEEDEDGLARYLYLTTVTARSSQAALREVIPQVAEQDLHNGRKMVATPSRSFRPVTVKVETKTALKFS